MKKEDIVIGMRVKQPTTKSRGFSLKTAISNWNNSKITEYYVHQEPYEGTYKIGTKNGLYTWDFAAEDLEPWEEVMEYKGVYVHGGNVFVLAFDELVKGLNSGINISVQGLININHKSNDNSYYFGKYPTKDRKEFDLKTQFVEAFQFIKEFIEKNKPKNITIQMNGIDITISKQYFHADGKDIGFSDIQYLATIQRKFNDYNVYPTGWKIGCKEFTIDQLKQLMKLHSDNYDKLN